MSLLIIVVLMDSTEPILQNYLWRPILNQGMGQSVAFEQRFTTDSCHFDHNLLHHTMESDFPFIVNCLHQPWAECNLCKFCILHHALLDILKVFVHPQETCTGGHLKTKQPATTTSNWNVDKYPCQRSSSIGSTSLLSSTKPSPLLSPVLLHDC